MLTSVGSRIVLHNKWFVLLIISIALFLVGIDMTVLYTALPSLTHDLGATNSQKLWIVNAYPLVMAGLLPGFGTLGDRVGHKHIFIGGLIIFGIASFAMAFSPSANFLIMGRAFLAVGAAMMAPATLALLRQTFVTDKERTVAIGIWGSVSAGATAFGPLIGGLLLSKFWWGSVFLLNVPVILVALIFAIVVIKKRPGNPNREWDFISSVYIMICIIGLIYALKEVMKQNPELPHAFLAFIIGIIFSMLFYKRQKRASSPMFDFHLFKNDQFFGGVLTILVSMIGLMGVQFALTQRLQLVLDYTPLEAGVFILPVFIASFIVGPVLGVALHRIGVIRSFWLCLFVGAIGIVTFIFFLNGPFMIQLVALLFIGFGIGGGMAAGSSAIMLNAPDEKAGMAASIESVSYELGGTLGVAIIGSLLSFIYTKNLILPEKLLNNQIAKDSIDQAILLSENIESSIASELIYNAKRAFDQAFCFAMIVVAAIMVLVGLYLIITTLRTKRNNYK